MHLALLMNPAGFGPNPHHRQQDPQPQHRRQHPRPEVARLCFGGRGFVFHEADYFPGAPAAQWLFGVALDIEFGSGKPGKFTAQFSRA